MFSVGKAQGNAMETRTTEVLAQFDDQSRPFRRGLVDERAGLYLLLRIVSTPHTALQNPNSQIRFGPIVSPYSPALYVRGQYHP